MRRICSIAAMVSFAASAAAQPSAPSITTVQPMQCVDVPFSSPVMSSITAHDVGGGAIEADIFTLAGGPPTSVSVTRAAADVSVRLDVAEGEHVCTMRVRVTGLRAGTYTLHLVAPNAHVAGPMGYRPGPSGEVAHTSVTVR